MAEENKGKVIILILDNSKSYHADKTIMKAKVLGIKFMFLPPYSPDLNPVEFIWKSIKREVSATFIQSKEHLRNRIKMNLQEYRNHCHLQKNGWKHSIRK